MLHLTIYRNLETAQAYHTFKGPRQSYNAIIEGTVF
jgi:hypothetical protein